MSLFSRTKSQSFSHPRNHNSASAIVTLRNHADGLYLSMNEHGNVSTVRIYSPAIQITNNQRLTLIAKHDELQEDEENVYYIRSHFGHFLTFDATDDKLYGTKGGGVGSTSWRRHKSILYARFASDALFYFTPSSTTGIIGATGISIFGNKFLCTENNGSVSNKTIPGKSEMWVISTLAYTTTSPHNNNRDTTSIIEKVDSSNDIDGNEEHKHPTEDTQSSHSNDADKKSEHDIDNKLSVISNLVGGNLQALNVYKQQIDDGSLAMHAMTMSDWQQLYNRMLSKRNQWRAHQQHLKLDINATASAVETADVECKTAAHDDNNSSAHDLMRSLSYQYNEQYTRLEQLQQHLVHEMSTLNELKRGQEQTSTLLEHANDVVKRYDDEIEVLQQKLTALKQKRDADTAQMCDVIMPKLRGLTQCVSAKETEIADMHEERWRLEQQLTGIQETKGQIRKFEHDLHFIVDFLETRFMTDFLPRWKEWNTAEIVIWLHFLNNMYGNDPQFQFENESNKAVLIAAVTNSKMEGKDLTDINDFILRNFGIQEKEDRQLILHSLDVLILQKYEQRKMRVESKNENENADEHMSERQCVICMDGTANMMFLPCAHICICQPCEKENEFDKCSFCGLPYEKIVKCYHVGF